MPSPSSAGQRVADAHFQAMRVAPQSTEQLAARIDAEICILKDGRGNYLNPDGAPAPTISPEAQTLMDEAEKQATELVQTLPEQQRPDATKAATAFLCIIRAFLAQSAANAHARK